MLPKIKAGIGTWVGVVVSILTLLPPAASGVIDVLENSSVQWSSGDKTSVIVGGGTAIVTIVGRMAQAVAHILIAPTAKGSPPPPTV